MFETLSEPVDVIASFVGDKMRPVRFRWRGRAIPVKEVTGHWVRREGATQLSHFSVQDPASDNYELRYDPRNLSWTLMQAWTEEKRRP